MGDGRRDGDSASLEIREPQRRSRDCWRPLGVIWTLDASSDLNANLVRFVYRTGCQVHVNDEVEVIVRGSFGVGIVTVDQKEHALSPDVLCFIPKGPTRDRGTSEEFAYLTVPVGEDLFRSASRKACSMQ